MKYLKEMDASEAEEILAREGQCVAVFLVSGGRDASLEADRLESRLRYAGSTLHAAGFGYLDVEWLAAAGNAVP